MWVLGDVASGMLLAGLAGSDAAVKDYAVMGLAGTGAGVGDNDTWTQVFNYLRSVLRRKRRAHSQSEVAFALPASASADHDGECGPLGRGGPTADVRDDGRIRCRSVSLETVVMALHRLPTRLMCGDFALGRPECTGEILREWL